MGIQDRDYMRDRRLRWDEARGEMRLDDVPVRRRASRRRAWAIVGIVVAVVVAGLAWWPGQLFVVPHFAGGGGIQRQTVSLDEPRWAPQGPVLNGRVSEVIDGDSIEVELSTGPVEVRMHSIDAPEFDQPGGREARAALERRLRGKDVVLEPMGQDQYGRMTAVVHLGSVNVDAWLVREGHAWVSRQHARDPRYCEAEMAARRERRGLWARPAGEQRAPWEWRAVKANRRSGFSDYSGETLERCVAALGKKRPAPAAAPPRAGDPTRKPSSAAPGECRIKGNVGSSGRIYHVPGSSAYEKTRIDESKGERWFCTEQEARAAGWRPPRG